MAKKKRKGEKGDGRGKGILYLGEGGLCIWVIGGAPLALGEHPGGSFSSWRSWAELRAWMASWVDTGESRQRSCGLISVCEAV